jgi:hypothetical protein
VPAERVAFGTSGHRGCSLDRSFNEPHILAITQAICLYRKQQGIDGPLYIGIDTHALSEPAFKSALEGSPRARPERRASTKFTRKVSRTGRTSTPYFAKPKRSWTTLSGEIVKAARLSPRRHFALGPVVFVSGLANTLVEKLRRVERGNQPRGDFIAIRVVLYMP